MSIKYWQSEPFNIPSKDTRGLKYWNVDGPYSAETGAVTQTSTLLGRIYIAGGAAPTTNTQTLNGLIRIQKSNSSSLSGLIRIQQSRNYTISGLVRIQQSQSHTISGLIRIQQSKSYTLSGLIRIQQSKSNNLVGLIRIQQSQSNTLLGLIRIQKTNTFTLSGLLRIQKQNSNNLVGKICIKNTNTTNLLGRVFIQTTQSQSTTLQGRICIYNTNRNTLNGLIRIQQNKNYLLTGLIRIQKSQNYTLTGLLRLQQNRINTLKGRIYIYSPTQTATLLGRIYIYEEPETPTRLYFSDTASTVTTNYDPIWDYNSEGSRYSLTSSKSNTALSMGSRIGPWTAGQIALDRQYISEPLSAQTLAAGSVSGQLMVREYSSLDNVNKLYSLIKVVSNDGLTTRGFLLTGADHVANSGEFINATTHRNKYIYPVGGSSFNSISIQEWDRLVIEIGYSDTDGVSPEASAKWGDSTSLNDLPSDETQVSDGDPWVEFSREIRFKKTNTLNGLIRIQKSQEQTLQGRIKIVAEPTHNTSTLTGRIYIVQNKTNTLSGLIRIQSTQSNTLQGLIRITGAAVSNTSILLGRIKIHIVAIIPYADITTTTEQFEDLDTTTTIDGPNSVEITTKRYLV